MKTHPALKHLQSVPDPTGVSRGSREITYPGARTCLAACRIPEISLPPNLPRTLRHLKSNEGGADMTSHARPSAAPDAVERRDIILELFGTCSCFSPLHHGPAGDLWKPDTCKLVVLTTYDRLPGD